MHSSSSTMKNLVQLISANFNELQSQKMLSLSEAVAPIELDESRP